MFGQHDILRPNFRSRDDEFTSPDRSRPTDLPRADFLEWMLDHTSSLVCGRHVDDTIFYVNSAYCRFFGNRRSELVGSKWLPPIIRADRSVLSSFSSTNDESTTCLRLVKNDQRKIVPLFVEYIGLFADEGHQQGFCSIARKPMHEPNRLSSIQQSERFKDFRIAQKDQAIRTLALSVAEAQEQERRRIALDLHDDIGQMLYLLRMKIDGLREVANAPEELDEPLAILDQVITKTRTMTANIGSHILQDFGLSEAIRVVADDVGRQYPIDFQISIDKLPDDIPNAIQAITYRIVRELLFNIVKHAQASFATISVQSGAGFIKVDIADNGAQANTMIDADRFGFGLKSVKEQIQLIGGVFVIKKSHPLGGTHVQFVMPTTASGAD